MIARKAAPFRDPSMGKSCYNCTVEHCIYAIYRAQLDSLLNLVRFNLDKYEYYSRVECGDFNIMVPGKFIAFAGPSSTNIDVDGYPALTPAYYVKIWKKLKVSTIIRLNKECYDKNSFVAYGFAHYDLYFSDGTTPSMSIVQKFFRICEETEGVIAIHCKAGLGRTGSLIGCYVMKHYRWTAQEFIGWARMCRPGSIIGPQQRFLKDWQKHFWKEGNMWRWARGLVLEDTPYSYKSFAASKLKKINTKKSKKLIRAIKKGDKRNKRRGKEPTSSSTSVSYQTDPGEDQGGILREQKWLSPRLLSPNISSSPRGSPRSPRRERSSSADIKVRKTIKIKSKARSSSVNISSIEAEAASNFDPRLESPRILAHAAPIRKRKKNAN